MLILTADEVRKSLPMNEAIQAMKQAYASLSDRRAVAPLRTRLPIPNSDALSLFMPAYVHAADNQALAVKAVSLFPTNPARGLAYIQAAVLVFDPQTGRAAALLEGSSLTAIRTGAAGGAAVDLLSRADSRIAAIFGAGAQGRTQLEAACTARKIETVYIFDPDMHKAGAFAEEMKGKGPIPREFRKAIGNRIYGCDDCLAACPWNKFASESREQKLAAREENRAPSLSELAGLDDAAFRARFSKSPIKRSGRERFIRNVLIAMGNSGSPSLVPDVLARLNDESSLVRGAAVWAASQLMNKDEFAALKKEKSSSETDETVSAEWDAA